MSLQLASATAKTLSTATADQLLPRVLLHGLDGMTDAEFKHQFSGFDVKRYKAAVDKIGRVLAAPR